MRKTYAPNAIIIGVLVGILVAVKVNAILAILAGLGISILGWVLISSLERTADRAGDALDDAIRKKNKENKTCYCFVVCC